VATNNTPNEGEKKKHRGKVKEVEKLQYLLNLIIAQKWIENINSDAVLFKNNYLL
jgi:hypothetical protein